MKSPSIANITEQFRDNGRRGEPRPGCDCMQCFGYCIVDTDQALRCMALRHDAGYREPDEFKLEGRAG